MTYEFTKSKQQRVGTVLGLILAGVLFFSAVVKGEIGPTLKPVKTDSPPVIDGILDDPVWQQAPYVSGFITWHPGYNKKMEHDSQVYFVYDAENLYFAFRCYDQEPDKIKASVTNRDNIRADDWIGVNLDTFNDQQSLYAFYVNPLGIQEDSRFEGGTEDFSVDMVWYSHGRIDEQGFVVEIKIPFKSIRFSHRETVEMAVIFERKISRFTEIGTYPALDPAKGQNWLIQMQPIFFSGVKKVQLFEILPAVTYSHNSVHEQGTLSSPGGAGDMSLTAKYGITSDLILDGTYNPDFSQVEADAGQVDFNLRYALFFPETRPFFQEGLEKFNFGGSYLGDPLSEIVHTRTIVDPVLGFKLNGKFGGKNILAAIYAMDDLPAENVDDYAHFNIFRYKRALSEDSFLGGFYTGRERRSGYNRVFGIDGQVRINNPSIFSFHLIQALTNKNEESSRLDGHAVGLHYAYNSSKWIMEFGMQDIGKYFQTETGYIYRTGVSRFRSGIMRMLNLNSELIKRIDPMLHSFFIRDKFSSMWETAQAVNVRFILPRSTTVLFGGNYSNEVFLGRRFDTSGLKFSFRSQLAKQLYLSIAYKYKSKIRYIEDAYQGKGNDFSALVTYLPSDKLHLTLSAVYSDFYKEADSGKEYDYLILRSRNTFQMNKYLFFRAIVEYNSFYKQMMTDLLASFTYIPGTVIHLGYGSLYEKTEWFEGQYRESPDFLQIKRGFFFKASYLWRF